MKEIKGDLWEQKDADLICITTNSFIKRNGKAVMGRGCALQAKLKFPEIDKVLAEHITKNGNVPGLLILGLKKKTDIWSFPTKYNWWEKSSPELIKTSALALVRICGNPKYKRVILPRPGCANGRLKWKYVKKILEPILDNRFYIISRGK